MAAIPERGSLLDGVVAVYDEAGYGEINIFEPDSS
jgi:hypothetical protein